MAIKREEKALIEFKHIMDDVVYLLRKSTGAETVYLYWVNRAREQFVLETSSTSLPNVMFQDRINFEQFFLNQHKEIEQLIQLEVGNEVREEELRHYYDFVPVKNVTLIPFKNNGEVVAITAVETEKPLNIPEHEQSFNAYRNALINVLNTYLELTDLNENQNEWTDYEESLNKISPKHHKVDILDKMMGEIQKLLPDGGVSLVLRGMDVWTSVLNSAGAKSPISPGMAVEEKSMAYDALQKGKPQFSIHFNHNPKRIATGEHRIDGATLAIPILISDRRHAVVIAYDQNPLTFKKSTKHKIINLVRVASLAIQVNMGKLPIQQDLFTSEYGSFIPDIWEKSLELEIERAEKSTEHIFMGLITIKNLQSIRSRFRLEDLKRLQKTLVKILNPSRLGFNGYIGFNSDYVFSYLLFCNDESVHAEWIEAANRIFNQPIELGDGQTISIDIKCGYTKLQGSDRDVHSVIQRAKQALSGEIKTAS